MEMLYCKNCEQVVGHKRSLGIGTFFAVLVTGGLWLLAIPSYPLRCIVCGLPSNTYRPVPKNDGSQSNVDMTLDIKFGKMSKEAIMEKHGVDLGYLKNYSNRMINPTGWTPEDHDNFLRTEESDTKLCPYCAETIKTKAIVCRFCGKDLEPIGNPRTQAKAFSSNEIKEAICSMKDPFGYNDQMKLAKKFNMSQMDIHKLAVELKGKPLNRGGH